MRSLGALVAFLLFSLQVQAVVQDDTPCINYWTVGMSGCETPAVKKKAPPSQTAVLPQQELPPPVLEEPPVIPIEEEVPPQEMTLDQKIDDFLKDHGKPPREFVAFHLEPTLENALKWVYAYNQLQRRNIELTRAWTQAEQIYEQAQSEGQDMTVLAQAPLMAVPDFGIPVPSLPLPGPVSPPQVAPYMGPQQVTAATGGFGVQSVAGLDLTTGGSKVQAAPASQQGLSRRRQVTDGRIGGSPDSIKVDYYFSAECPYCARFEPEFQQIVQEMGPQLDVTCVDVTPSGAAAENIFGKVDCAWRPAYPGELQRVGVRTTPSLIINRGPDRPLERVSGYVEGAKLKTYLLTGRTR
jgi:thiol-disulfide isomerase/thioredoxin